MGRKTVALSLNEDVYDSYKKFCEKKQTILSRKVEEFMKKELKEGGEKDNV